MKDYVVSALDFSKAKDAELAWIDGSINTSTAKDDVDIEVFDDEEEMEADKC